MSLLTFGYHTHIAETMPSTQDAARALVEQEGVSATGFAYRTKKQTAGRGRQGKAWYTPPGANLCITFIGPPVAIHELWQVSFVSALAAADTIAVFTPNVPLQLRFPNDVLLNGKKVCGILVETAMGPHLARDMAMPLIGIGINVQGKTDALPPEIAVRATTIEAETGEAVAIDTANIMLAEALTQRWTEWRANDGFTRTLAAWHSYHPAGSWRNFIVDGESVPCRVLSVSQEGNVLFLLPNQQQREMPVAHVLLGA